MGLEGGDHPACAELSRRCDRGRDLRRMVGVVVVDPGAVALALELEAPGDPGEARRAPPRRPPRRSRPATARRAPRARWPRCGDPGPGGRPRRRFRRRGHGSRLPPPGSVRMSVAISSASGVGPPPLRLQREADDALALVARQAHVGAADEAGRGRREGGEGLRELRERAPAGVVIELQVGDHRDLGTKLEEAGIALVGLGDHPLALPPSGVRGRAVRSGARQLSAEEEGRVGADSAERPDAHRGRRRLAVCPGDGQQPALQRRARPAARHGGSRA